MASLQSNRGNDPSVVNTSINKTRIKSSIPDFISEDENHMDDEETEVIRFAHPRPFIPHYQHPIKIEEQQPANPSSPDNNYLNDNRNSLPSTIPTIPTKRRFLVAVVVPPVKRINSGIPEIQQNVDIKQEDMMDYEHHTPRFAAGIQIPLAKKTVKFFSQIQRDKLEECFNSSSKPSKVTKQRLASEINEPLDRVNRWFSNRRIKAKLSDETNSSVSTPSTSPRVSPAPKDVEMCEEPLQSESESEGHSSREDTPGEGNLGSSSAGNRPYIPPPAFNISTRSIASIRPNDSGVTCKADLGELTRKIAPLLKGGSISRKSNVDPLVGLMATANDTAKRNLILNALISTQSSEILGRFVNSEGLNRLSQWIDDARNNMKDIDHQETLLRIIRALKALPLDSRTLKGNLKVAIVLIAGDKEKDSSNEVKRHASELLQKWQSISQTARRRGPTPLDVSSNTRKETRSNSADIRKITTSQDISKLPKFKLRSPTAPSKPQFPTNVSTEKSKQTFEGKGQTQTLDSSIEPIQTDIVDNPASHQRIAINFDPSSSQHNKAMEALRNKQKKSKTVRFKDGLELEAIKYFEKDPNEDEPVEYERESSPDGYSDDDDYQSFPDQFYPSNIPAFILPENLMDDYLQGVYFRHPHPLMLESVQDTLLIECNEDNHSQEVPQGEDHHHPPTVVAAGENSTEKDIQAEREAQVQPSIYRTISDIPWTPAEPDSEEDTSNLSSEQKQIPLYSNAADYSTVLLQTLTRVYQMITIGS
ncbi:hypothetical protein BGZ76_000100 [Entomortierella beljakovae]|nr:hypothetical protein BGZ76_000100 [Entomortierella beljakovae]